ncbi:MAG: ATP-grasp domain-containing protein [Proteobacteria bacterium]|nr:ATP-grasp domain-containing protein [Pseudomonadota bacterium]
MSLSGDAVLIAAFSGRSLAQSARRAGFRPLVVDAFGDLDTRDAAEDLRVIDGAMETGFRTKPLIAALNELSQSAPTAPIGLVLGSGLEDQPRLVNALASRFRLLGCDARTLATCKDPKKFFALLDELAIPHPATQIEPPSAASGWISKRIGGSGGRHIRDCSDTPHAKPRRYFQKRLTGMRYSIGALSTQAGTAASSFALSRQWTSPSPAHPYRFGGCVSQPAIDVSLSAEMIGCARKLCEKLQLRGLASFDFIVEQGVAYLLEVNPRPGASLDVLDDRSGSLFARHIAACTGAPVASQQNDSSPAKAMAILHADRGPITLGYTPWPNWSADRGTPGTFVPLGAPLATAFAEASTADAAEALARQRLAELEDLIYGHAKS